MLIFPGDLLARVAWTSTDKGSSCNSSPTPITPAGTTLNQKTSREQCVLSAAPSSFFTANGPNIARQQRVRSVPWSVLMHIELRRPSPGRRISPVNRPAATAICIARRPNFATMLPAVLRFTLLKAVNSRLRVLGTGTLSASIWCRRVSINGNRHAAETNYPRSVSERHSPRLSFLT